MAGLVSRKQGTVVANVVLAPYFTKRLGYSQHDSSHNGKGGSKPDDYSLMRGWYESVRKLGLEARIFHNEMSDEFVDENETEKVKFVYYDELRRPSYNDNRFYAYHEWLKKNDGVLWVLCTDLFDVKILMNPFKMMAEYSNYTLFTGSEKLNPYSGKWMRQKCRAMELEMARSEYKPGNVLYNAGIIGGKREDLMVLFQKMMAVMDGIELKHNANMPVYNYCIDRIEKENGWRIFTGYPLHNEFGSNKADTGVHVMHK